MWDQERLVDLIDSKLRDYRLILVSNREPCIHRFIDGTPFTAVIEEIWPSFTTRSDIDGYDF
jgi:hypothetical protein